MMILLSCKLRSDADRLPPAALEDLVQWATINTLYWSDGDGLYLFESNYRASEINAEFLTNPDLSPALDRIVVFEFSKIRDVVSTGLPSETILRAFADLDR